MASLLNEKELSQVVGGTGETTYILKWGEETLDLTKTFGEILSEKYPTHPLYSLAVSWAKSQGIYDITLNESCAKYTQEKMQSWLDTGRSFLK